MAKWTLENPCKELYYREREKEILQLLKSSLFWAEWNKEHLNTINHNYFLWQLQVERMVNNLSTDMEVKDE